MLPRSLSFIVTDAALNADPPRLLMLLGVPLQVTQFLSTTLILPGVFLETDPPRLLMLFGVPIASDPVFITADPQIDFNSTIGVLWKLTYDDELHPGLLRPEPVDPLALVDAGVADVGRADPEEALALAVPRPRDVVDGVTVLGMKSREKFAYCGARLH